MSGRGWERYFHTHENARRELRGLEPLPEMHYTLEDREDDQRTLACTIPAYQSGPGWQSVEGKAFLEEWECGVRDRLETNNRKDTR